MNPALDLVDDLVRRIHEADGRKAVIFVAGGGTEIFPWLLSRGGGSATLLAGRIPYDPADFHAILGADLGKLVDARAARGLAMAAFRHGLRLRPDLVGTSGIVGIAGTSKLASGLGERVGRSHEIHLALQTGERTFARSIILPGGGDRVREERINARALLNLMAEAKGLAGLPLDLHGRLDDPGRITEISADASTCGHPGLPALLGGQTPWLAYRLGEAGAVATLESKSSSPPTRLILPGSFRPLHDGHLRMAAFASGLLGQPCAFELSLFHPEKPPLDYVSIAARTRAFAGAEGWLLLTDAPTYLEKARLFPGSTFVIGHDTAVRIIEPRWYGGLLARDLMLDELEALGTRFLVFGRVDSGGQFRDLALESFDDLRVARFVERTVRVVAESEFRSDLSSTSIRLRATTELP